MSGQTYYQDTQALFVLENWLLGSSGASISSTHEDPAFPCATLLDGHFDTASRSSSVSQMGGDRYRLRTKLARPRRIDTVLLGNHNIRSPWGFDLYTADPSSSGPALSVGPLDPIVRAPLSSYTGLQDLELAQGSNEVDLAAIALQWRLRSLGKADAPVDSVRWIDIWVDSSKDSLQAVDYYQLGHIWAAQAFKPKVNISIGWEGSVEDLSEVSRSEAGSLLGRQRPRLPGFSFTLGYLDRREAFIRLFNEYAIAKGSLGRVFAWLEPHQPRFFYEMSLFGTASSLPASSMANLDVPAVNGWALRATE